MIAFLILSETRIGAGGSHISIQILTRAHGSVDIRLAGVFLSSKVNAKRPI